MNKSRRLWHSHRITRFRIVNDSTWLYSSLKLFAPWSDSEINWHKMKTDGTNNFTTYKIFDTEWITISYILFLCAWFLSFRWKSLTRCSEDFDVEYEKWLLASHVSAHRPMTFDFNTRDVTAVTLKTVCQNKAHECISLD